MENGRLEPLRALSVHREAQRAKHIQCTLIFGIPQTQRSKPHSDTSRFSASFQAPWGILGSGCKSAIEARTPPGNPSKTACPDDPALRNFPDNPGPPQTPRIRARPSRLSSCQKKREDVGIEGVALNPNRK